MTEADNWRGQNWAVDEVRLLLQIWSEESFQIKLKESSRNILVFAQLAKELRERHNIQRTAVQCREKIKKLRHAFWKAEDANRKSGNRRHTCPFYDLLAPVLRDNPQTLMSSQATISSHDTQDSLDNDQSLDNKLEVNVGNFARGTAAATTQPDPGPSTSGQQGEEHRQQPTPVTTGQRQSQSSRSTAKRKADFDAVQALLKSFKDMQEATVKSFNEAHNERLRSLLELEERREKREEKKERRMFSFLAELFGDSKSQHSSNHDDSDVSDSDEVSATIVTTDLRQSQSSRRSAKRKAGFDTEALLKSFKDTQEATVKSFHVAENERLKSLIDLEERREKRDEKKERRMFRFLAQLFGDNKTRHSSNNHDSDVSDSDEISATVAKSRRVL